MYIWSMIRRIVPLRWSLELADFIECPLDDADNFTIQLARRINGRNLTDAEFKRVLEETERVKG